jgi:hypothetical protein
MHCQLLPHSRTEAGLRQQAAAAQLLQWRQAGSKPVGSANITGGPAALTFRRTGSTALALKGGHERPPTPATDTATAAARDWQNYVCSRTILLCAVHNKAEARTPH